MEISINSIKKRGILEEERIVMEVVEDFTDIGNYALFQTGYRDEQPTTGVNHTYWFPHKYVTAGDLVILYSRSGVQTEKKMKSGNTAYFYFWGKDEPMWDDLGNLCSIAFRTRVGGVPIFFLVLQNG